MEFINKVLWRVGLRLVPAERREAPHFPHFVDQEFKDLYGRWYRDTMVPWAALYMSYLAAKHVARQNVPGALVECGVFRGGCALMMAETLLLYGEDGDREIYLYDTFEGMPEPEEHDVNRMTGEPALGKYMTKKAADRYEWCLGTIETVAANVERSRYPKDKVHLVKGKVEDTIPGTVPEKIALLRLDTDWYASTIHEMNHLYGRLVRHGVLIVDDYGAWEGARKAVDEFLHDNDVKSMMHIDPMTGRALLVV